MSHRRHLRPLAVELEVHVLSRFVAVDSLELVENQYSVVSEPAIHVAYAMDSQAAREQNRRQFRQPWTSAGPERGRLLGDAEVIGNSVNQ
jgi:hypothetical protein